MLFFLMLTGLLVLGTCLESFAQTTYSSMGVTYHNPILNTTHTIKTTNTISNNFIHVDNYHPEYNRTEIYSDSYDYNNDFEVVINQPLNPVFQAPATIGVNMASFDNETDALIDQSYLESSVVYTSDKNYNTIWMTEYDENGNQIKQVEMPVVSMEEDSTVMTFYVENGFNLLFWKDGSMVVYEFADQYVILEGAVNY